MFQKSSKPRKERKKRLKENKKRKQRREEEAEKRRCIPVGECELGLIESSESGDDDRCDHGLIESSGSDDEEEEVEAEMHGGKMDDDEIMPDLIEMTQKSFNTEEALEKLEEDSKDFIEESAEHTGELEELIEAASTQSEASA